MNPILKALVDKSETFGQIMEGPNMTNTKHTTGPWHVGGGGTDFGGTKGGRFGIGNGSTGSIAHVNKTGLIDREEAEANAYLIAAAPELLSACRIIYQYWKDGDADRVDFAMKKYIRKAILKAKQSQ